MGMRWKMGAPLETTPDPRCYEVGAYIRHKSRVYEIVERHGDDLWLEDIVTYFQHCRTTQEVGCERFSLVKPAPKGSESN